MKEKKGRKGWKVPWNINKARKQSKTKSDVSFPPQRSILRASPRHLPECRSHPERSEARRGPRGRKATPRSRLGHQLSNAGKKPQKGSPVPGSFAARELKQITSGVRGPGAPPAPLTFHAAVAQPLCQVPAPAAPARLKPLATPRRPQPSPRPQPQPQLPALARPKWERPRPPGRTQPPPTVQGGRGRAQRPQFAPRAPAAAAAAAPAPAAPDRWRVPSAASPARSHGGAAAGARFSRRSKFRTRAKTRRGPKPPHSQPEQPAAFLQPRLSSASAAAA